MRKVQVQERGFALITALGVLVILMILAFGAAATVQFTFGYSTARLSDRNAAGLMNEAAENLVVRGVPEPGTPTIEVLRRKSVSQNDVQVSATVQQAEIGNQLLGNALALRDGDRVVELSAATNKTGRITRTSSYLLNTKGLRTAPILLLERRL